MKTLYSLKNNHGLTITELLIAMALTTIVGLGVFETLKSTNDWQKLFSEKMDNRIEANLADKLILRDLRAAGPSMNNLKVLDDNNQNFYDFESDRSSVFYRNQNGKISRTVTLQQGGNTFMYFLAFDDLRGKGLFADAVTFFEVGPSPANINQAATLTYKGLNNNNYLLAKDSNGVEINNSLLIQNENLNKLVLVDSSSYMPTIPQRPATYIGAVTKVKDGLYDLTKIDSKLIPKDKGNNPIWNYLITTPDNKTLDPQNFTQYMYNLPPVGANGASVRLKAVRLYKYELDCTDPKNCILYRQDVLHGSSQQRLPLLQGFNCIRFTRNDIANSVFVVETNKYKCKKL